MLLQRPGNRAAAAVHFQFFVNVTYVVINGVITDAELIGDFFCKQVEI